MEKRPVTHSGEKKSPSHHPPGGGPRSLEANHFDLKKSRNERGENVQKPFSAPATRNTQAENQSPTHLRNPESEDCVAPFEGPCRATMTSGIRRVDPRPCGAARQAGGASRLGPAQPDLGLGLARRIYLVLLYRWFVSKLSEVGWVPKWTQGKTCLHGVPFLSHCYLPATCDFI